MSTAIELHNVWKSFKRGQNVDSLRDLIPHVLSKFRPGSNNRRKRETFWALKDVSFEINQGETVGLIGPNGSGKTTTLKLLSGILRQTRGDIFKRGRIGALIEIAAGFHGDLTGRENIYLNGSIMGMKKCEINKNFDEIIAFAEVEDFIDTPVKRYSTGMYVRLGFSVAAHLDPDILLIDEVLAVGDIKFQQKCIKKMHNIVENGCTLLFVSHSMPTVESVCNRSILLNHGKVLGDGSSSRVINKYLQLISEDSGLQQENLSIRDSHIITIISIDLLDSYGNIIHKVGSGKDVTFRFTYSIHRKIGNPILRFLIYTENGTVVFETKTRKDNFLISGNVGSSSVNFEIEELCLAAGKYHIGVSMTDESDTIEYDWKNDLCFFEVLDSSSRLGIVSLKAKWKRVNE